MSTHSDRTMHPCSGFTLLELLIVVAIIGILASIAIPAGRLVLRRAQAQSLATDLRAIEVVAHQYYADNKSVFPADRQPGEEPPELKPYLRNAVKWTHKRFNCQLDWDNWINPNGTPKHASTRVLIGVSVVTKDKTLIALLSKVLPNPLVYTLGDNYTYVIVPLK